MSSAGQKVLEFHGGVPAMLLSFGVMFAGILWLGFTGSALPEAFWPFVILGLFVGLVLAKDRQLYIDALVRGISSNMLAIMLLAWFLAGIMARLLRETGLIEGLIWMFIKIGISSAWFPLITFLASSMMSLSTGTSVGTIIGVTPILFPVGYALGANPLLIVGAVIGGAFVGDNLAPISDTTIVSAYSQGTTTQKVVRTRLKYAVVAGTVTILTYIAFAIGNPGQTVRELPELKPMGLAMLLVPILLMYLMIRGQHLVSAMLYSTAFGMILALATGLLTPSGLLSINKAEFTAGGIVIQGIADMWGVAVFTIFLMGMIGTLEQARFIDWLIEKSEKFATTPRRAEIAMVFVSLLVNALTTAGTPTMVMLGPWVRRLGHRFRIAPWRRGNLLDATSCSIIGFLPYSVAVLIPFAMVGTLVKDAAAINFTPVGLIPYVFYCWALMLVMIFAAATSWGIELIDEVEYEREAEEIYGMQEAL
ncbi:hypothetical protein E1B22_00590 [Thermaerobacter sp. FW80]|uniref:Na+/H+ antiporter NhaC family protein n=1 Tax=Thermaerobacter sp. FW80 TaxID=2546351 RepID=UPI001074FE02|nr:Na+/H+ antiporter NhaC family protein [Thermaerobacter sp. FW80]QBS36627.1 hypothetical protein E1B22_00590 [Thermaerobacter sp. FW80]